MFLVGYRGKIWSGGSFRSEKNGPAEAAAEQYVAQNVHKSPASPVDSAVVSDFSKGQIYFLKLVGDPEKPAGWVIYSSGGI